MTLPKSSFRGWCLALCVALLSIAGKAQVLDSLVFGVYDQGTWPEEVSWNIVNADGDIVLAGDGYDATYSALLNSGCYTINMYDSFGDGWTGGTLTLYVGDDPVPLVFTLTSGSYGQESFGINAEGCGPLPVQGCTDPTALNYNWLAEEDDGSCEYCNGEGSMVATVYVCTFSNGGQVELQVLDGDGNELLYVEGLGNSSITYYEICLSEGECYTINMFNNAGPFGWYGGYFWINGNGVQYVNQSLDAGASSESTFFSIDNTCSPYPGCTDPEAVNYDANANIDDGSCVYEDCDTNFALVTVTQGTFPGEVGWSISDADGNLVASGGAPYFGGICLGDGCYTIIYSDSFGDGWNGAVMSIEGDAVSFSGTLNSGDLGAVAFGVNEEGCEPEVISGCTNPWADNYDINAVFDDGSCIISGCTDPTAINYDYSANNDDGSCEYCDGEGSVIATLYVCTFSNGGQVELQLTDDQGNEVIYVSGLSNGTIAYFDLCLQPGTCYTVTMINNTGAYGWYGGYYWINGGGIQLSTGALYDGEETSSTIFSIDGTCGPVYGCTDPSAINYDPEATANDGSCQYPWYGCTDENAMNYNPWANTDDGSCVYPEDCTQNLVEFVTNGGFFPGEIAWYAYDLDFNYVASNDSLYSNSSMACIGDECLFIYLYDSFGDGWNGGSVDVYVNGAYLSSFTLDTGASGQTLVSIGGGSCDIEGCTDPLALNYNYTATVDDGSCTYPEDCTNNFVTITINTQLWGSEVSWTLVNGDGTVAASGSGYNSWDTETQFVCLEDGCYELQMSDSWGDGWNGAYYMIYGAGVYAEGSLLYGDFGADIISVNSSCEVDGCTDPEALNYNPAATWDDGSCVYNDNDGFGGGTGWLNPEIEVALYPNPVSEEFVLNLNHLDGQRDINLQIVDVAGKVVWTQHIANSETMRTMNISAAALQAGYYFLQVENGSMSTVKTFVRQ